MELKRHDDWHLHLTVVPRPEQLETRNFVSSCVDIGWRPLVIENFGGGTGDAYYSHDELIPSAKTTGELGQAIVAVHDAAKFFSLAGWLVRRMKIEGRVHSLDSMYCETHVLLSEIPRRPHGYALSRSRVSGKLYGTVRGSIVASTHSMSGSDEVELVAERNNSEVEWCVLDTCREMDAPWMRSWGRTW